MIVTVKRPQWWFNAVHDVLVMLLNWLLQPQPLRCRYTRYLPCLASPCDQNKLWSRRRTKLAPLGLNFVCLSACWVRYYIKAHAQCGCWHVQVWTVICSDHHRSKSIVPTAPGSSINHRMLHWPLAPVELGTVFFLLLMSLLFLSPRGLVAFFHIGLEPPRWFQRMIQIRS